MGVYRERRLEDLCYARSKTPLIESLSLFVKPNQLLSVVGKILKPLTDLLNGRVFEV